MPLLVILSADNEASPVCARVRIFSSASVVTSKPIPFTVAAIFKSPGPPPLVRLRSLVVDGSAALFVQQKTPFEINPTVPPPNAREAPPADEKIKVAESRL